MNPILGMATMTLLSFFGLKDAQANARTAYEFQFNALTGDALPLAQFKGKVLLVVNTASRCGFTPQYEALEAVYQAYKEQGLVVIGVPSNDFGAQEPGGAEEIQAFCQLNYGVTFPMTEKTVVSGNAAHPFYRWAYQVLGFGSGPKWNFHKYLIGRDGRLVTYFNTPTKPNAPKLVRAIETELAKPASLKEE